LPAETLEFPGMRQGLSWCWSSYQFQRFCGYPCDANE
jgi:hypothetical protein